MAKQMNTFKNRLRQVLPVLLVTLVCIILISVVNYVTKDKIRENKERKRLDIIRSVIPDYYNNDLLTDWRVINIPEKMNKAQSVTLYRARLNNQPIGVAVMPVIAKGYHGDISLVVSIAYDGSLFGIKVLHHNETEGLGDQVHQDNSDWLDVFSGNSFETIPEKRWSLKKDGGDFDQLSGATITSRGIANVTRLLLTYYVEHRDEFYK